LRKLLIVVGLVANALPLLAIGCLVTSEHATPAVRVDASVLENVPAGFTFVEMNAQGYPEYTHDLTGIRFVLLPGGSFRMGSPESEVGHEADEGPVHGVHLRSFLIGKYEVKQADYEAVMKGHATLSATPSAATGPNLPVELVSWADVHAADGFLERTGLSLPTEAQWEYACRAGQAAPFSGTGDLDDMGWYKDNSSGQTHDVGTKQPNQFGLFDMHGNVWEFCEDVYKETFYSDDVSRNDPNLTTGRLRTIRGGSQVRVSGSCRSGNRGDIEPGSRGPTLFLGFRAAVRLP
jgi:formylglycine-generating enzyme required for sulfatase activity